MLNEDIAALPYLRAAVIRMLEELPGKDGLSRTERQILKVIDEGMGKTGPLFGACQAHEEAMFMGDWSFFQSLEGLANSSKPAIHGLGEASFSPDVYGDERKVFLARELRLTDFGREILAGEADFAAHNAIDFWWGGSLITDHDLWRWDHEKSVLIGG